MSEEHERCPTKEDFPTGIKINLSHDVIRVGVDARMIREDCIFLGMAVDGVNWSLTYEQARAIGEKLARCADYVEKNQDRIMHRTE